MELEQSKIFSCGRENLRGVGGMDREPVCENSRCGVAYGAQNDPLSVGRGGGTKSKEMVILGLEPRTTALLALRSTD